MCTERWKPYLKVRSHKAWATLMNNSHLFIASPQPQELEEMIFVETYYTILFIVQ